MNIKDIDKNFDTTFTAPEDIEWFSVQTPPFSLHGIFYSEEEHTYRRMPRDIAGAVNPGVSRLSKNTAGGRVRFQTDSPYIAVRMESLFESPSPHLTIAGKFGVTIYADRGINRAERQ